MSGNKKLSRAGKRIVAMILATGLFLGGSSFAKAEKTTKEETVYVNTDAAGEVRDITVKEVLVTGKEEETKPDKTTEKETPVSVEFSYKLDGKEVLPTELAGKSGTVEITVTYHNKSKKTKVIDGKKETLYTPFFMVTGIILPKDKFTEVSVENGEVLKQGTNQIVVGYGAPGLVDSLKIEDREQREKISEKIPESFTIKAQVADFELSNTITYASAGILSEFDLEKNETLEEIEDGLEKLTNASEGLTKGAGKLSDAAGSFEEGLKKYAGGEKKITSGIKKLYRGLKQYQKGVKDYTTGVDGLAKGMKSYVNGAKELVAGVGKLDTSIQSIVTGEQAFSGALNSYTTTVDKMAAEDKTSALLTETTRTANEVQSMNTKLAELKKVCDTYAEIAEKLKQQAEKQTDNEIRQSLLTSAEQLKTLSEQQKIEIEALEGKTEQDGSLKKAAEQVKSDVGTMMSQLKVLSETSETLRQADGNISSGIRSFAAGVSSLKAGSTALSAGNQTLLGGAAKLEKAGKTIRTSGKTLVSGMSGLVKGSRALHKSTSDIIKAAGTLHIGIKKLDEGIRQFDKDGIQKLEEEYGDTVKNFRQRLTVLSEISKEYRNFDGTEGIDGDVTFILETEKISKEE